METAVSVHDALMAEVDKAARDLGLSRSELVAEALRFFLRQHRQAQVTRQLNRAYETRPSPGERAVARKLKAKLPVADAW
jgi:metal-responsive CopG/Arc/MetJ family transcriptional regulator